VPPAPLCGDEALLFAKHHAALRGRVRGVVKTSDANVDEACSFAWMQLIRRQPTRATVLAWLTTVAIREAIRLDRQDRRTAHFEPGDHQLLDRSKTLTHARGIRHATRRGRPQTHR
jgi:DNA-directed RNA polymerase specialized sigma24 family protein